MLDQPFHNGGESDQNIDGKSIQSSSNNWNETDQNSYRDHEADAHVAQNLMEGNIMNKGCEMPQSQKCVVDKRDNKMESGCGFLIKQKEISPKSELNSHADVCSRSNSKTSNRCSDKLSIDEDLEATIKLQQAVCSSKRKDVKLGDFLYVATRDIDEEIKSEIEVTDVDDDVVLHSERFENQCVKKCSHILDDYLQTSNGSDDMKMKADSIDADRGVVSSNLEIDVLPLNDLDSPEDWYLAQTSLYDSSQSMHDSSQSALRLAASTSFIENISQYGNASDVADSRENLANTDSSYFSTTCDPIEINSDYGVSIEPDDRSEQQEQTAVNYPERDTTASPCNLQLGYRNSAVDKTLSFSLLLSPGGSSTMASEPHTVDHPLSNGEKQQMKSPHSQYCFSSSEVLAAEALDMDRTSTDLSDTGKFKASEITLPSLSPALAFLPSCSYDSQEPLPDRRHIKSIFNTFMNHRLKTDVCNDGVNDIADELAFVMKGSRKRVGFNENLSTPQVKKPRLVDVDSTSNSDDSKQRSKKVDSSCPWSRIKVKRTVQNQDDALVLCSMCDTSSPRAMCGQCQKAHYVCKSCLEDQVRLVMASDKLHLSCPEISCSATIPLDSLSSVLPSLVVDILSDNLHLKAEKATAKAMKKMQELVISHTENLNTVHKFCSTSEDPDVCKPDWHLLCPRCACPGLLDEWTLQFVCANCQSNCCHYCKAAWLSYEQHDGCFLLSFVGAECLQDIVKVPRNWDMTLTPFNKNYLQVNVPLNSAEGSTVAEFFAKTASYGVSVVQIFRIQNRKLWEKYVLKRKHVVEEIGAEALKEKFMFHGTRAENIVNICSDGFDHRVPTANGAVLGKGIYFSVTAQYSEKFTDKSRIMYLARVICGWSQQGQKKLTRPEYHSASRRMYDSCVDNTASPTIFTVFENSQCYPEYLIHFRY